MEKQVQAADPCAGGGVHQPAPHDAGYDERHRHRYELNNEYREILERLSNAHGVSGSEGSVFSVIREELDGCVDELREDALGNLIAVKKGGPLKVMVAPTSTRSASW
jgi:hypothetical protein